MRFFPSNTRAVILRSYTAIPVCCLLCFNLFVHLSLSVVSADGNISKPLTLLILVGCSCVYIITTSFVNAKRGIYLNADEVLYRRIRSKVISCSDIETIVIVQKKYFSVRGWSGTPYRNVHIDGRTVKLPFFAIILLGSKEEFPVIEKHLDDGSEIIEMEYRECVLGTALYDEELLHELLRRNPNINILTCKAFKEQN